MNVDAQAAMSWSHAKRPSLPMPTGQPDLIRALRLLAMIHPPIVGRSIQKLDCDSH
jgi:hypothetical protein